VITIARRPIVVVALSALVAACTAASPSPSAEPTPSRPSPTPAATASPTQPPPTPAATASASPSPTATAAPPAADTLEVAWTAEDLTGIGAVESIRGVTRAGDTYVLLASLSYGDDQSAEAAVWWSDDGASWHLAQEFPVDTRMHALTVGGPGFVVAGATQDGAAVWTSADGRDWEPVRDPSLARGTIFQLISTASGLVAFGSRWGEGDDGAIWTSSDGLAWLAATNETGLTVARGLQAVASYGGRAIAFVSEGDEHPPGIWETTGRAEWTRTGTLKDVGFISKIAGGARGWVALGSDQAWTSTDGRTWNEGVPGPDVHEDVIVDDAGFIAVGFVGSLPGETCGDQRPFAGYTWTSSDGAIWERMSVTEEFQTAMVTKLLVVDRTLIGFGQTIKGAVDLDLPVARWTDTLPTLTTPGDESDEASVFESCGG